MKGRSWIKGLMGVLWLIVATTATAFAQTSDTKDLSSDEATENGIKKPELIIPDSLRAVYKYTEGLKQLNIFGDTVKSQKLLREALEIDSTYSPALYELASQIMEGGKNDAEAIALARKAYLSDTTSRWYTSLYAQTMIVASRLDDALPIYARLMRMDSKNPDVYRILAILYQQRHQPFSAIAVLDSADMRLGKIPYLTELKRHLLVSTHQYDRAIEEAQQSVEDVPYEQSNHLTLAQTYAAAGRDSLAKVKFKETIAMDSTNVKALSAYADYCSFKNDGPEYIKTLQSLFATNEFSLERKVELIKRLMDNNKFYGENYFAIGRLASTLLIQYPDKKEAIDIYGDHLLAGGDLESALKLFKQHLEDEPPQLDYYMAVIDIEEYLHRADSVDIYVEQATQKFSDNPILYIRKANRQYGKGNLHGAIESFNRAMLITESDTLRGELWGYIGDTYHAMGEAVRTKTDTTEYKIKIKPKKAAQLCYEAYEKALEIHYDNASVLNNYAYYLSEEDRELERALEMSARAIELQKSNSTFLDTYAWILFKLGRYEEARTYMRQALSLDRTNSGTLALHYGDILFALGDRFMAETYWQRALKMGEDVGLIQLRLALLKSENIKSGHISIEEVKVKGQKGKQKRISLTPPHKAQE
ncbi:MAG: tetratricopeptide repeat protein [Alistipes sp.]|nr:tetratricopeptide repeat protein [Alistipes sp.]